MTKKTTNNLILELSKLDIDKHGIKYILDIIKLYTTKSNKIQDIEPLNKLLGNIITGVTTKNIIHMYGQPNSGKSILLKHICNLFPDIDILWIDSNATFDASLLDNPDNVYVYSSSKIQPITGVVKNYGMVVIDDFGAVTDPQNLSNLIGNCRESNTLLIATNQIRMNSAWVPVAMRSKLSVLFDISLKLQRTKVSGKTIYTTITTEQFKQKRNNVRKYKVLQLKEGRIENT